jgi:hypothetical protein
MPMTTGEHVNVLMVSDDAPTCIKNKYAENPRPQTHWITNRVGACGIAYSDGPCVDNMALHLFDWLSQPGYQIVVP